MLAYWGKHEQAYHTIWQLIMVPWSMHKTDAIRNESIVTRAALYNLWIMVPWFIIKQTVKLITCRPPIILLEWFHGS